MYLPASSVCGTVALSLSIANTSTIMRNLTETEKAECTIEFMKLFQQMLKESRFFVNDERSLRNYLIEEIEDKKQKAEIYLKSQLIK